MLTKINLCKFYNKCRLGKYYCEKYHRYAKKYPKDFKGVSQNETEVTGKLQDQICKGYEIELSERMEEITSAYSFKADMPELTKGNMISLAWHWHCVGNTLFR